MYRLRLVVPDGRHAPTVAMANSDPSPVIVPGESEKLVTVGTLHWAWLVAVKDRQIDKKRRQRTARFMAAPEWKLSARKSRTTLRSLRRSGFP